MKKSWVYSLLVTAVIVSGTLSYWKLVSQDEVSPIQPRGPASFKDEGAKDDWKKYISKQLRWNRENSEYTISLYAEGQDLCEIWSSVEITFRAEGIAYSGEPSRLRQTAVCQDLGFYQKWPRNLMEDHADIKKVGHFEDEPEEWGLESLRLMGPLGSLDVSGIEIYQNTGIVFLIETKL